MEVALIYTGDDDSSTLRYPKLIESRQITWKEILDEPILFRAREENGNFKCFVSSISEKMLFGFV